MTAVTETLIIGAGPAGLAVAGRLRKRGLPFDIVDKSDSIAARWRGHYDRLCLHTVKELSHLPFVPFPDDYPRYVPRNELVRYYEEYAERFEIAPRFSTEVVALARENGTWRVRTGDGVDRSYRNVVVATGVNRVPNRPELIGEGGFAGAVIHACDYRNPSPYAGRRTLVVGMGNTGAEIALDLAEAGSPTALSVRSPVNIVPRDVLGRPTQLTARMLARLPTRLGDRIGVWLRRLTVGSLDSYGLETPDMSPAAQLRELGQTPVIDVGTVAAIKSGAITVKPGVDRLEETAVVFTDGSRLDIDVIVLATGYRARLADLVDLDDPLFGSDGLPTDCVGEGKLSGVFFVGFDNHRPGGILGTVLEESELVANAIAATAT